jgi:hypothetical protein
MTGVKSRNENTGLKSGRAAMSGLRRHGRPGRRSTCAAGPQNLSASVQGMRWQGTDTKDGPVKLACREIGTVPVYSTPSYKNPAK